MDRVLPLASGWSSIHLVHGKEFQLSAHGPIWSASKCENELLSFDLRPKEDRQKKKRKRKRDKKKTKFYFKPLDEVGRLSHAEDRQPGSWVSCKVIPPIPWALHRGFMYVCQARPGVACLCLARLIINELLRMICPVAHSPSKWLRCGPRDRFCLRQRVLACPFGVDTS